MICPQCKQKISLKWKDFSYDRRSKPKKEYLRKVFWCEKDDVWITVETPTASRKK